MANRVTRTGIFFAETNPNANARVTRTGLFVLLSRDLFIAVSDDLNNWTDSQDFFFTPPVVPVSVSDTLNNWSDTASATLIDTSFPLTKSVSDDLNNWNDTILLRGTGNLIADDLNRWGEALNLQLDWKVTVGDQLVLSDSINNNPNFALSFSDQFTLSDSTALFTPNIAVSDQLVLSDDVQVSRNDGYYLIFSDTLYQPNGTTIYGLKDGLSLIFMGQDIRVVTDEFLPFTDDPDVLLISTDLGTNPGDQMTPSDEVQLELGGEYDFAFYDQFELSDDVQVNNVINIGNYSLAFGDTLLLNDGLGLAGALGTLNWLVDIGDQFTLSDSIAIPVITEFNFDDSINYWLDAVSTNIFDESRISVEDSLYNWSDSVSLVINTDDISYLRRYLNDVLVPVTNLYPVVQPPLVESFTDDGVLSYLRRYLNDVVDINTSLTPYMSFHDSINHMRDDIQIGFDGGQLQISVTSGMSLGDSL